MTKLGVQWREGIRFILDDQLAVKRLRFEDAIQDKADDLEAQDAREKFDIEFSVMALELRAFIDELVTALGGLSVEAPSVEEKIAKALKDDTSYTGVEEIV